MNKNRLPTTPHIINRGGRLPNVGDFFSTSALAEPGVNPDTILSILEEPANHALITDPEFSTESWPGKKPRFNRRFPLGS